MSAIRIPRAEERYDTGQVPAPESFSAPRVTQAFVQPPPPGPTRAWPAPRASERADLPSPNLFVQNDEQDLDMTRLSSRRGRTRFWTLALPDDTVEVVVGSVIIGRAAAPMSEWPEARLISLDDPTRSMSKNHAVFAETHGTLVVQDLQSTNGILVVRGDGHEVDLGPWEQVTLDSGSRVELGDVVIRVQAN
jgi:pSer/pThr/pTyr-binding forkhead associated (FHA) protein